MSLSQEASSKTNGKLYCAGTAENPVFAKNCSDKGILNFSLYFFKLGRTKTGNC